MPIARWACVWSEAAVDGQVAAHDQKMSKELRHQHGVSPVASQGKELYTVRVSSDNRAEGLSHQGAIR
jgi:hypothetical protein